jgi:dihydrolipoamide dehydrogenase
MERKKFDLVVLGGGPGGYPAAIRAAQNGLSVAIVEGNLMGGTCLNRGCIPTKALIANASILKNMQNAKDFGIVVGDISFDFSKMKERKDKVVEKVRKGLEGLIKSNGITWVKGWGKFLSRNEIEIADQDLVLEFDKAVIATGSEPKDFTAFPVDGKKIHDSTTMLDLTHLPKKLVIIGAGIIGCEFASLYQILGVEIVMVEMMDEILPLEPKSVSSHLRKIFDRKKIGIRTQAPVEKAELRGDGVVVKLANGEEITADMALVAIGRKMNTDKVGLDRIGVQVEKNGLIQTSDKMETNLPGIYAVGDISSKFWLAHVASHQGIVAAMNASGKEMHMRYNAIPSVIFTEPEIATVGMSLEQAIDNGYEATVGQFPFQALGKAVAESHTEGFAQIVKDKNTGQILGAQIVGHDAGTLIAEMGLAVENELTTDCVAHTIHAHPTVAEIWMEAALVANEEPIHWPPSKK